MIHAIHHLGYIGIFITIFLEIGLMIFPLPGDTLLFTTGIMSNLKNGVEIFNYPLLILTSFFASVVGGHFGYFIGTKINREQLVNNKYFKINDAHLLRTEKFFETYGAVAIIFSRFVPIVRNFISQILGILNYDKKKFAIYNTIASIIWPFMIITIGKVFGAMFPNLINYAEYAIAIVLVVLCYPVIKEVVKQRKS